MKRLISMALCSVSYLAVYSQQFIDATQQLPVTATSPLTMDAEMVDLDNDGDLDLILACEFKQNLLLFNDGTGQFKIDSVRVFPKRTQYTPGSQIQGEDSEEIVLADFNQDSILDLFFASEDTPYHELLFGTGNGHFVLAPQQIPKNINANAAAAIDPNGDGWPDILLGNTGQNELYINQGNGTFELDTTHIFPVNTNHTQDLKMADIDHDGDLDILEGIESGGSNLYTFDQGTYTEVTTAQFPFLNQKETRKIVVEDIDNDGDLDLFLCNVLWQNGVIPGSQILINDGSGNFTDETLTRFPYVENYTLDGVFVDLNNDQYLDLVTVGLGDVFQPKVYFNDPDTPGNFTQNSSVLPNIFQDRVITIIAGDLNGDSLVDIFMGSTPDRLLIQNNIVSTSDLENEKQTIHSFYNASSNSIEINGNVKNNYSIQVFSLNGRPVSKVKRSDSQNKVILKLPVRLKTETMIVLLMDTNGQIVHHNLFVVGISEGDL